MAYSSQGSHTGQLDFCNWLADDSRQWLALVLFEINWIFLLCGNFQSISHFSLSSSLSLSFTLSLSLSLFLYLLTMFLLRLWLSSSLNSTYFILTSEDVHAYIKQCQREWNKKKKNSFRIFCSFFINFNIVRN